MGESKSQNSELALSSPVLVAWVVLRRLHHGSPWVQKAASPKGRGGASRQAREFQVSGRGRPTWEARQISWEHTSAHPGTVRQSLPEGQAPGFYCARPKLKHPSLDRRPYHSSGSAAGERRWREPEIAMDHFPPDHHNQNPDLVRILIPQSTFRHLSDNRPCRRRRRGGCGWRRRRAITAQLPMAAQQRAVSGEQSSVTDRRAPGRTSPRIREPRSPPSRVAAHRRCGS